MHRAVAFGNARAALAVKPDRVDLVEIGHRAVPLGDVADLRNRGEIAVHRIERFEGDDLGRVGVAFGEQPVEMARVVVAEYLLLRPAVADAGDHRGVVVGVRDDHAARQGLPQRPERRLVGDIARGEQERGLGPVKPREFLFEQDVVVAGSGDVARASRAGADPVQRLVHRRDDLGVLPHAEIVVAAPHGDVLDGAPGMARRHGKRAGVALQIREHPVAPVAAQARQPLGKEPFVIHYPRPRIGVRRVRRDPDRQPNASCRRAPGRSARASRRFPPQ